MLTHVFIYYYFESPLLTGSEDT